MRDLLYYKSQLLMCTLRRLISRTVMSRCDLPRRRHLDRQTISQVSSCVRFNKLAIPWSCHDCCDISVKFDEVENTASFSHTPTKLFQLFIAKISFLVAYTKT